MGQTGPRILVVEDDEMSRELLARRCRQRGYHVTTATDGYLALGMLDVQDFDLVLLDIMMPRLSGFDVLEQMKADQKLATVPVIIITALHEVDDAAKCIKMGAEDVITKPFNSVFLLARIEAALERRSLSQQHLKLQHELEEKKRQLEIFNQQQMVALVKSQQQTIFILSELLDSRFPTMQGHLERLREYCRVLLEGLQFSPGYAHDVNDTFVMDVINSSPLHDIGMAAIPENIINKQGELSEAERNLIESHTLIGGNALRKIESELNSSYIKTGIDIVEHHHERWDGNGYPHKLKGESIPLAARICAIADAYDAMTSSRSYKKRLSHEDTKAAIINESGGHFDPGIIEVFKKVEPDLKQVHSELSLQLIN